MQCERINKLSYLILLKPKIIVSTCNVCLFSEATAPTVSIMNEFARVIWRQYLCFCLARIWLCPAPGLPSLSVCLSIFLSICLSICMSACLSFYLSVCLSVCMSVSLRSSVCLPVWMSVCQYICIYLWTGAALYARYRLVLISNTLYDWTVA